MELQNQIPSYNDSLSLSYFIILGFQNLPQLNRIFFLVFLLIYLFALLGNLTISTVIHVDSRLHTPMYFFLTNLSMLDICYTSVTAPKLLSIFLSDEKSISFIGCMTQLYFFMSFGTTEYLILTIMAYDRYVAICKPLQYTVIMSKKLCIHLAMSAWATGFLVAAPTSGLISNLLFCGSRKINHLFCDVTPLLTLSCSDTRVTEIVIFLEGVFVGFNCLLLILISYVYIITSIFKISSQTGRSKAFSTCASHLTSVSLYYGVIFCLYMRPTSSYSLDQGKFLSVIYIGVIPMLNPIIYSLRNKEFKRAMIKVQRELFFEKRCLLFCKME
ncbi:olfactory receptor 5AR1-like [Pleurodeles waltl]|uniref:olfactory receptor 5AR1-like n=1 Tax=Pleurodeles waltl TaxID=8319 RepID=UPI003709C408